MRLRMSQIVLCNTTALCKTGYTVWDWSEHYIVRLRLTRCVHIYAYCTRNKCRCGRKFIWMIHKTVLGKAPYILNWHTQYFSVEKRRKLQIFLSSSLSLYHTHAYTHTHTVLFLEKCEHSAVAPISLCFVLSLCQQAPPSFGVMLLIISPDHHHASLYWQDTCKTTARQIRSWYFIIQK